MSKRCTHIAKGQSITLLPLAYVLPMHPAINVIQKKTEEKKIHQIRPPSSIVLWSCSDAHDAHVTIVGTFQQYGSCI